MSRESLIKLRKGTAAQWESVNPVLALGEPGFESDTLKFKVGDGNAAWNSLRYVGIDGGVVGEEESGNEVQAATLYFYYEDAEEADSAWTEVGNWWLDAEHTEPAGRLPTSDESVVATASITASGQTVVDFTLFYKELFGTLTVTGMATFDLDSGNRGTLNGNATFINGSVNAGTVAGNATFNDNSFNDNAVTGDATFNDSSTNNRFVTGTATFTGNACNDGGTAGTFVPDPPPAC